MDFLSILISMERPRTDGYSAIRTNSRSVMMALRV